MDYLLAALLTIVALIGHGALWVTFINRLNAIPLHYLVLRWINRPAMVLCGCIALVMVGWVSFLFWPFAESNRPQPPAYVASTLGYYFLACWLMAAWASISWLNRQLFDQHWIWAKVVETKTIDVAKQFKTTLAHGLKARLANQLPLNQFLKLEVRTLEVELPKLPPGMEGLSLIHLTDFHMAGHVGREYFEFVVDQANELGGDLVLITGDVLDEKPCLDWLELLGRLKSRYGTYFLLGNHDYRVCPPDQLRQKLGHLGLNNIGGLHQVIKHKGRKILLAGNELPWHREPPKAERFPMPPHDPDTLSIALAHTPDEYGWAREEGFDLMLAGHLHGGQIRIPLIGPVLSPSRFGVRYCGGTFYRAPTVLHVSRGISGMMPLRFNCLPELSKLVLRRG